MTEKAANIAGIIVNEQLAHFGLMTTFDEAVRSRKLEAVIEVLQQAQLSQSQAEYTAKIILANPGHYGY